MMIPNSLSILAMAASTHQGDPPKQLYSQSEVAQHNSAGDLWVIIDQKVYDLSQFLDEHPGGSKGKHLPLLKTVYSSLQFS